MKPVPPSSLAIFNCKTGMAQRKALPPAISQSDTPVPQLN